MVERQNLDTPRLTKSKKGIFKMKKMVTYLLSVLAGALIFASLPACAPMSGDNHQQTYYQYDRSAVGYQFEAPVE